MPLRSSRIPSLFAGLAVAALALTGCAAGAAGSPGSASRSEVLALSENGGVASVTPATGALSGDTEVTIEVVRQGGDSEVTSVAFGTEPAASFSTDGGDDGTITAVTPPALDFAVGAVPVTVTLDDGTELGADAAFAYEVQTPVDAQMQYAFTHWNDYNLDEWGEFPDNDCGNFVNQSMLQRGWTQSPEWYSDYVATGDYSYSWIRGNEMDAYYASRPDTTRYEFADRGALKIGDVVMFDWDPQNDNGVDHTMMISKVTENADGTISIGMVGHTLDAPYRDLDNAVTVEKPGGTAHFWSIA
jgi:hypothetical protein